MPTEILDHLESVFLDGLPNYDAASQPPAPSPARAAAEAAFEAPPSFQDEPPSVIVTTRKKSLLPRVEPLSSDAESSEPKNQARAARVFRVDTPIVGTDAAQALPSSQLPAEGLAKAGKGPRKRRRSAPRGKVTIVRAAVPAPATSSEVRTDSQPSARSSKSVSPGRRPAPRRGVEVVAVRTMQSSLAAARRYQAILSKIADLEKKSTASRQVEAGKAVEWIKQMIQLYGLDAADVGL